jgi:RNA polymerase sigma-70 factor (ECF subfamily)
MLTHAGPEQRREWVLDAVQRYEASLVRFAWRLVGDEHTARDIVQHAFLRLCDQAPEELEGRMAQWLFAVCRNKAVDYLRSRKRSTASGEFELPRCVSKEPDPAAVAERRDLVEQIGRLIADLPGSQREAISLWAEGMAYRDIAETLQTTEGNVRVLMHRAIKRLREHAMAQKLGEGPALAGARRASETASEVQI